MRECNHIPAGGTFTYHGPDSYLGIQIEDSYRRCEICGYTEKCFNPFPGEPHYIQWKPDGNSVLNGQVATNCKREGVKDGKST